MDNNLIPFWEKAYQDDTTNAFSAAPNATLKEFEHLLHKNSSIQEIGCNLVEHLSFVRNPLGKYDVECRDTVGGDHHKIFVIDVIYVADFAVIDRLLTFKVEVGVC